MSDSNTQAVETEKVKANWDAVSLDPVMGDPNYKPAEEPKKEDVIAKDVVDPPADEKPEEVKPEEKPVEEKKEEKPAETTDEIKVTLEDISEVPQTHKEGTLKYIAQQLGKEIKEESIDSFKEVFISKEEAENKAKITKEDIFAKLKPETAAALELQELGLPEDLILNPTKEIDEYLKLDAAALVRANLAATDGWTQEMIDTEIEDLIANGKLAHEDAKIRIDLNKQKNAILAQRTELVQKFTAQQQEAVSRQKEQEKTQFIETMNKVSTFMGVTIPDEVKKAFITKYNNGVYDKELSSIDTKVNYILKKELEGKITKHIQNKASEQAKKSVTDKLLNIPPVKANGGGKVITNEQIDNWGPLEEDFGGK
jgi:hypothetical protein